MKDMKMDDELKTARAQLLGRQIARQDLNLAATEKQLMRADVHRKAVADVVGVMDAFLAGLAERLGNSTGLADVVVHELHRAATEMRLALAEQVESITAPPAGPSVPLALQRLSLGTRSRAAQAGRKHRP